MLQEMNNNQETRTFGSRDSADRALLLYITYSFLFLTCLEDCTKSWIKPGNPETET